MAPPEDVGILGLYLYFPRYVVRLPSLRRSSGAGGVHAVPLPLDASAACCSACPPRAQPPRTPLRPCPQVSQSDLEAADGVAGKYTQGLGQLELGFCGDREDVVSMAATAALRVMEAYAIAPQEVGK
jgi:3-hydroxy-3-methylglutaryl CoA synthase